MTMDHGVWYLSSLSLERVMSWELALPTTYPPPLLVSTTRYEPRIINNIYPSTPTPLFILSYRRRSKLRVPQPVLSAVVAGCRPPPILIDRI